MESYYLKRKNGTALPREDRQFLKKVEDGICYRDDMDHEMPLLREENFQLPNESSSSATPARPKEETPR